MILPNTTFLTSASPAQSPAPDATASFHPAYPALSPGQSGRNSGTPRWRVLPALQSRNSNCARASGSACAGLLRLASAVAHACGSPHAVSPAPGRRLPTVPQLPTIGLPREVPITRPLPRQTILPTNSAAGAAIGSLAFLPTLVNSTPQSNVVARTLTPAAANLLLNSDYFCTGK